MLDSHEASVPSFEAYVFIFTVNLSNLTRNNPMNSKPLNYFNCPDISLLGPP